MNYVVVLGFLFIFCFFYKNDVGGLVFIICRREIRKFMNLRVKFMIFLLLKIFEIYKYLVIFMFGGVFEKRIGR